ncbi:hypothetical protein [Solirubrum puertoriconensis]|uniref:Uncharacterized protein n=1 Tax=Solirubrum puertoriconensis TaxID=1751427 RepID=A0A9X0HJ68_SOLP1|nr:hypothetical protein [Solirubrum puertoriconensis]KUG06898.1 hypothetical protein ASU33_06120 [Solirubrum puertoriconensis]
MSTSTTAPTLSVSATRRVLLSKELCRVLGLKAGHRIDLIPPPRRGGVWHLDIRPRVGKPLTHTPATRPMFFCAHHISRDVLHDGVQVRKRIKLVLADEVAATAGLYRLLEQ